METIIKQCRICSNDFIYNPKKNLYPLCASENHIKSSKIVLDDIHEHLKILKEFCKINELTNNHSTFEKMIEDLG